MAASVLRLGLDARIVIAGAGSIGCFAGGLLMRGGRNVSFLGRPRALEELRTSGLHLTDLAGLDERFPAWRLTLSAIPSELRSADLVLVTVKSGATDSIASDIAAHCRPGAVILTLQNGVSNKAVLSAALPHMTVLGGIVAYNVVHQGAGAFHRGTSGGVTIEAGRDDVAALLSVPGFGLETTDDLGAIQWGKLLLNLNNALNALSGLPLLEQLQDRDWRRLHADQIEEALAATAAAGIRPAPMPIPPRFIPAILRLPTPLFRLAAARVLRIDPKARSSMWEDLMRRKPTEIDYLQGEVVALGKREGVATPVCSAVTALIKQAETAGAGPPGIAPALIRKAAMG